MPISLDEAAERGKKIALEAGAKTFDYICLWPQEFAQDTLESAWGFVQQLRTWNESEKAEQHFPDEDYFPQVIDEWLKGRRTGSMLITEKSRRMVTSWLFRALELWDLGLKRSTGVITHFTNEDAGQHVWRIWHLYNDLRKTHPMWRLPPIKTYGALADQVLESVIFANGSKVEKHYEKPEGLQGSGYSWVTCEELSMYASPASMLAQAQFVTKNSAGGVNGFIVVVTNASANEDWQKIKGDEQAIPQGLRVKRLPDGSTWLTLHYSADPKKDKTWAAAERKAFKGTQREWDVQMEMKQLVTDGIPVHGEYVESLHAPDWLRAMPRVPQVAYSRYFAGWDIGSTLHPAFVLIQVTPNPRMTQILGEVVAEPGTSFVTFLPMVIQWVRQNFPYIDIRSIFHGADESGQTKNGVTGTSTFQVAAEHGIIFDPISNALFGRLPVIDALLKARITEDVAAFTYHPDWCPVLHKGFLGGYRLKKIATAGKVAKYADVPEKDNIHDNVQDACLGHGEPVTTARGQVPIQDVKPGDMVLTRQGFRRVLRAWQASPCAGVVQVVTAQGDSVICTPDHKIWTTTGWTRADACSELALSAAIHSSATDTSEPRLAERRVVSVRKVSPRPVYDLEVEGEHEFFAGGILVHNCQYACVEADTFYAQQRPPTKARRGA